MHLGKLRIWNYKLQHSTVFDSCLIGPRQEESPKWIFLGEIFGSGLSTAIDVAQPTAPSEH